VTFVWLHTQRVVQEREVLCRLPGHGPVGPSAYRAAPLPRVSATGVCRQQRNAHVPTGGGGNERVTRHRTCPHRCTSHNTIQYNILLLQSQTAAAKVT